MLYKEINRWGFRLKDLESILDETANLEKTFAVSESELVKVAQKLLKGIVRKRIRIEDYHLSDFGISGYSTEEAWFSPSVGFAKRSTWSSRSSELYQKQLFRALLSEKFIPAVEKYAKNDTYIEKAKILRRCAKRLEALGALNNDRETAVNVFALKSPFILESNACSRAGIEDSICTYKICALEIERGHIELLDSEGENYLERYSRYRPRNVPDFVIIQPLYSEIKAAAKKYRTALKNISKKNDEAIARLKNEAACWLVLGGL